MKVNDMMAFSHRPQDGISIGVAVVAGVAYFSVSFVRRGDSFSRKLARRIVSQRIISTLESDKPVTFVGVCENVPEKVDARGVVRELRKLFKPDPTCNDNVFFKEVGSFGNMPVRAPMSRDEAFTKIAGMFDAAVKTAANAPARAQA